MKLPLAFFSTVCVLSGCTTANPVIQQQIDDLTACQKVEGLLQSYPSQFNALKMAKVRNKFMDVWQAKYHLVGDECQISQVTTGSNYQCQKVYTQATEAVSSYQQAVSIIASCLDMKQWHKTESLINGVHRATFSAPLQPEITVLSASTLAKVSQSWQTSVTVGTAQPSK